MKFRAVIRPPNPRWTERTDRIRELVDKPNADHVVLEVAAFEDRQNGLVVEDTILEEVVQFQSEGYAAVQAEGFAGTTKRSYDSRKRVEMRKVRVSGEEEDHDVWNLLMELARRR